MEKEQSVCTKKTVKVGLTGGIGSGKTTVAGILRRAGYAIYIADQEASRLINENLRIRTQLKQAFGEAIYNTGDILDKKRLSEIIFNTPQALAKTNAIVHPAVLEDFTRWCRQQTAGIVFFESAILFESGLCTHVDCIICISASLETRIARVVKRDNTTREKVLERIRNQMDEQEKCRKSDFTINTDEGNMLLDQLFSIIASINQLL